MGRGQAQPHHRRDVDDKGDGGDPLAPAGVPIPAVTCDEEYYFKTKVENKGKPSTQKKITPN